MILRIIQERSRFSIMSCRQDLADKDFEYLIVKLTFKNNSENLRKVEFLLKRVFNVG